MLSIQGSTANKQKRNMLQLIYIFIKLTDDIFVDDSEMNVSDLCRFLYFNFPDLELNVKYDTICTQFSDFIVQCTLPTYCFLTK